jgi:hypothetical protein
VRARWPAGEARGDAGEGGRGGDAGEMGHGGFAALSRGGAGALQGHDWRWKGKLTSGPRFSAARVEGEETRWRPLAGWAVLTWVVPVWAMFGGGGREKGAGLGWAVFVLAGFGLLAHVGLG